MIDHVGFAVKAYEAAKEFYGTALAPLGYVLIMEVGAAAGFGRGGKPDFWIEKNDTPAARLHLAVNAATRAEVDAFYKAALAAGAKDNGPPGLREIYHPHYYGAFVIDPEGHNLEAVCHTPS